MIRVLLMIAVAGFVLCVGALSAAVAIGGPDIVARGGWKLFESHWEGDNSWSWDGEGEFPGEASRGPTVTRTLEWSGTDSLEIDLPADVRYVQSDGPASVVVTGPQSAVQRVVINGDSLRYERRHRHWHGQKLDIVVRAPTVESFDISGRSTLVIENYRRDRLRLDVSGAAEVTGSGETDEVSLDIAGQGDVDLGGLKTRGADVDISGAGDAILAPTEWAKLDISGMGDVRLLTRPARLETDISGAGRVREDAPEASPSPSPSPPASPSPSPKSSKL